MVNTTAVFVSGVISLAVSFLVTEYQIRRQFGREKENQEDDWYRGVNKILTEHRHYCQKQLSSPNMDYQEIAEKHEHTSDELAKIVGGAPENVDLGAVREIENLAGRFYSNSENIGALSAETSTRAKEIMGNTVAEFNTHFGDTVEPEDFAFLEEFEDWDEGRHELGKMLIKMTMGEIDSRRSKLRKYR